MSPLQPVDSTLPLPVPARRPQPLHDAAWVFGVVFVASLFGIFTRPVGFLAAFWPANALLLGLLVRNPRMVSRTGWLAAFLGYVVADVLGGDEPVVAVALTLANLSFVGIGVLAYRRLRPEHARLQEPLSPLYMFGICAVGAFCGALVSLCLASPVLPALSSKGFVLGLGYWFSSELVNGILVVPLVLAMPRFWARDRRGLVPTLACRQSGVRAVWHAVPVVMVACTVVAAAVVGGPGAIAFPSLRCSCARSTTASSRPSCSRCW